MRYLIRDRWTHWSVFVIGLFGGCLHRKSITTFAKEMESVGEIPGLLWGHPDEFRSQDDPFRSFEPDRIDRLAWPPDSEMADEWPNPDVERIEGTEHVRLRDPEALEDVLQYRFKSGLEGFAERFHRAAGVDLDRMRRFVEKNRQNRANLTMRFGMEAYGTYLPWHAFARSSMPWGIYILPVRIAEWADYLLITSTDLPSPPPSWEQMFFTLFWATYRHELFHWHVETFALRLEVLLRERVYRPYVEQVRIPISKTQPSKWWEEALAQAVVLKSRLVAQRSRIPLPSLRKFLRPDFRTRFGDGYRHFECASVGGIREAHRILSAQVARTQQAHDPRSTDLALIKHDYALDDARVPGYFCFSVNDFLRFQLAPAGARSGTTKGGRNLAGTSAYKFAQETTSG